MQKEPVVHVQREKKKKKHFNQFSPESREKHSYLMSKNLPFLSIAIVLYLKYRSNSAEIDSENNSRWGDKKFGLSLWGDGGLGLFRRN